MVGAVVAGFEDQNPVVDFFGERELSLNAVDVAEGHADGRRNHGVVGKWMLSVYIRSNMQPITSRSEALFKHSEVLTERLDLLVGQGFQVLAHLFINVTNLLETFPWRVAFVKVLVSGRVDVFSESPKQSFSSYLIDWYRE